MGVVKGECFDIFSDLVSREALGADINMSERMWAFSTSSLLRVIRRLTDCSIIILVFLALCIHSFFKQAYIDAPTHTQQCIWPWN